MKAYWDSSALVEAMEDEDLYQRLVRERAFTRTHSLAEFFSALTKNSQSRTSANDAALAVRKLMVHLDLVDVTAEEVADALDKAQSLGVRGGRVHDLIHAIAARKSGALALLTLDQNDFGGLVENLTIEQA